MLELRHPVGPLVRLPALHLRPAPRTNDSRSDVSPNRLGWKAGGVGALNRVRPGGWWQARRTSPSIVNCLLVLRFLALSPSSDPEVGQLVGLVQALLALPVALAPPAAVPDLDPGEDPGDDDVRVEAGVLAQVLRDRDAALLVRA